MGRFRNQRHLAGHASHALVLLVAGDSAVAGDLGVGPVYLVAPTAAGQQMCRNEAESASSSRCQIPTLSSTR